MTLLKYFMPVALTIPLPSKPFSAYNLLHSANGYNEDYIEQIMGGYLVQFYMEAPLLACIHTYIPLLMSNHTMVATQGSRPEG